MLIDVWGQRRRRSRMKSHNRPAPRTRPTPSEAVVSSWFSSLSHGAQAGDATRAVASTPSEVFSVMHFLSFGEARQRFGQCAADQIVAVRAEPRPAMALI